MREKNLNVLERMEGEKVRVTGNDVRRLATHSEFEELIVLGITASRYVYIHIDPLSFARQSREKTWNIFLIDVSAELFPAQNFVEFG